MRNGWEEVDDGAGGGGDRGVGCEGREETDTPTEKGGRTDGQIDVPRRDNGYAGSQPSGQTRRQTDQRKQMDEQMKKHSQTYGEEGVSKRERD